MSDTHFTRLTWKPGKRRVTRPRKRHYGGQIEAPLALLAAARLHQFGSGAHRQCEAMSRRTGERCRAVCIADLPLCHMHRGAAVMAARGQYVRPSKGSDDTP